MMPVMVKEADLNRIEVPEDYEVLDVPLDGSYPLVVHHEGLYLPGLEQYVAESYDARSFVELLQNADDAGAPRFVVQRTGDFLMVANDGRPFTRVDFESLCRSAASHKHRGTTIGYRGIGFKS